MNIIDESEMIYNIYDFINKDNYTHALYVGGMIGTKIFKHVVDAVTSVYKFNSVLFLDGCQDFLGLIKPLENYKWYPYVLRTRLCDSIDSNHNALDTFWGHQDITTFVDKLMMATYGCLVINNAHLIDKTVLQSIVECFYGKVIVIVDPFDDGEYYNCDTIIETNTTRLPLIHSMARSIYNIETPFVDKNKSSVKDVKMGFRSIGKIDDKVYITNDDEILKSIREKQYRSGMRKNQKLIVTPNRQLHVYHSTDIGHYDLAENSLLTIDKVSNGHVITRLYSSKITFQEKLTYDLDVCDMYTINVTPANILSLNQAKHHRYKNAVLVIDDSNPLSKSQMYSILKNTINLQVVHMG